MKRSNEVVEEERSEVIGVDEEFRFQVEERGG